MDTTSFSLFTFMHWRKKWQPTPVFLPGESHGRGILVTAVYGVTQSRTWLKWLSSSSSSVPECSSGFPYFLQFKCKFGKKEFMIWATVSSWSCFCWLYRAFSILGCKEYNQSDFGVDHLVKSMCRVFYCVVGRGYLLYQCILLALESIK